MPGPFMKLRWKYFLTLLAVSLIPMAIVTTISQNASKNLGNSISTEVNNTLVDSVKAEIVAAVENYAMITMRAKSSIEFALRFLVREAASAIALPPLLPLDLRLK